MREHLFLVDGGADAACGMRKLEFLKANVASARAYEAPLPPAEMERLRQLLAGRKVVLERCFANHHDAFPA